MKFQIEIESKFDGSGTQLAVSGIKRVEDAAGSAKKKLDEVGHGHGGESPFAFFTKGSDELFESLLKTVSLVGLVEKGFELLGEAIEWTKEAIHHADFVRDLNLSLQAYTGSAAAATKVIDYFTEAQERTRNTAEELQQTFRNLNPLATAKGFSNEAQAQITVMLSQIATASNKSFSDIEAGYRRVLSGVTGGASRNQLLQILGISGNQLASMGWDEFLARIQEASHRADEFGQSWGSTMHKAEVELKNSFAEGWNEARGSAVEGMDAITAAVNDPEVKEALKQLGRDTAEWAGKLGGVLTMFRGIAEEIKGITSNPNFRLWLAVSTLGASEVPGAMGKGLALLGASGNEKLTAAQTEAQRKAAEGILLQAGVVAPQAAFGTPGYSSYTGAYKGMEPQGNITAFKDLANLEKYVADQVTANHLSAEQIAVTAAQLKLNAAEAQKAGLSLNVDDVNAAIAEATKAGIEGAPHGKIGKPEIDRTPEIEAQTKQLLMQAEILDLQNEKLGVQAQLAREAAILGEKKTGLETVELDANTKQLLLAHEIHALRVVDLDQQMEMTKAVSDYWTTIADIDKKQKEEAAKPGGGTVSAATFDKERQAAGLRYNATLDAINAKMEKGQSDAYAAQRKLTLEAQAIVQARNEELLKIRALVGAQGEEDAILARQLSTAKAQGQLFGLELALQNQGIAFGATRLSQQTDSLLKMHEQITLQQTANDTEIEMQEERSRYAKQQADLAKQMSDVVLAGYGSPASTFGSISSVSDRLKTAISGGGVNPAIDQLTLLAAQQREGSELHLQAIIENGHLKIIASIKSEAELRNAKIEEAMKGYADLANLIASTGHDLVADLFGGGDMKHMLQNLVTGYQSMLGGALDGMMKKYLNAWQQMAQGTIDPATGKPGHIDPATGKMVPTSAGQQQTAQNAALVAQGAVALYSTYQAAQTSKTAGVASGAIGGATLFAPAGPYGMVAGAIIGAAYGAVFSAIAEGSKARFELTVGNDGRISVSGFGKATSGNVDAAMRTINQTVQSAAAAVRGIIDAFPIAIASGLAGLGNLPAGTLGTEVEKTRTFAISIFKKSFKGGYTADQLQHFMTEELPKILLDSAMPSIEEGLKDLGVNLAKIASLEKTANEDPQKAFQFITDYVTGFVAMRDSIAFLGKSTAEKTTIALGLSVDEQVAKANERIAYLGKGFADLANEDQVDRLKQINAAIANRYQLELQFLADVANARKAIEKSYADTAHGFGMSAASPQDQLILLQSQRAAVAASLNDQFNPRTRQMIEGAKTPAEVTAIAESYANLTTQIYNAAKSLRDSFQTILDSFKALDDQKAADALAAMDPTAHLNAVTKQISGIASQYAGMSDADKIANGQTLIRLAQDYYNIQKQALIDLGNAAKSIHDSITQQIFGIQLDQKKNDPQAQIEMLMAQRRTLYTSLNAATTADQINAIIQQIQSNVTTVAGLEGNTPEAAARSIQALQEADKAAQLQLAALTAQAKANDDAITAAIKGVGDAVTATIADLNTLMTNATNDLVAFGGLIQTKLSGFVDAMAASDAALLLTLQPIFDALGNSASTTGDSFDDANTHLHDFSGALGDATDRLRNFADGNGFGGGGNAFSGSSFSVQAPPTITPQFNIDISGNMAPFVTLVRLVANEEMNKRDMQAARFARSGAPL